jgi:hypothetical protein
MVLPAHPEKSGLPLEATQHPNSRTPLLTQRSCAAELGLAAVLLKPTAAVQAVRDLQVQQGARARLRDNEKQTWPCRSGGLSEVGPLARPAFSPCQDFSGIWAFFPSKDCSVYASHPTSLSASTCVYR